MTVFEHPPMIPYARQDINEDDIAAVEQVLRGDWLTQGPTIPKFEETVARRVGARHACAVNSGTSALHLACLAAGLSPGQRLWTTPITFVASANCARYCGAEVDFVDIDPRTHNICPDALEEKLKRAELENTLPKVVIAVDFAGQPADWGRLRLLANQYRFVLIDDASHALGATYRGDSLGSGRFADFTVFSFHPVKIITTGEGGMILTNDFLKARRLALLRSHGITRDTADMEGFAEGDWYYQQLELGFNYRMTDIQAALGLSQMQRLDSFIARRRELAANYDKFLRDLPVTRPWLSPDVLSAWHLYVIRIDTHEARLSRREVFDSFRAAGIQVNVHYIPVYLHPYYRRLGFTAGYCPEAERYYRECISLPMYANLSQTDQKRVVQVLTDTLD